MYSIFIKSLDEASTMLSRMVFFVVILWALIKHFDVEANLEVRRAIPIIDNGPSTPIGTSHCDSDATCDCSYSAGKTIVNCSRRDLASIPENLPKGTTHLLLSKNRITSIKLNSFSSLRELRSLDLSFNNISSFAKGALAHLSHLRSLDMTMNECFQFQNLRNITHGLNRTSIRTLKANFLHSPMYFTSIEVINEDLENLVDTKLKELYVDGNQIQHLQDGVLKFLPPTLRFLSVKGNELGNMRMKDLNLFGFAAIQNLAAIDISFQSNDYKLLKQEYFHHKMENVRHLKRPKRYIVVDNVTKWTNHWNCESPNISLALFNLKLTTVIAQHAGFTHCISRWNFGKLPLKHIDFSRNSLLKWIGPVTLGAPQRLKHVDFSNNNCYYIGPHFFQNLTSVQELVLRGNMLGATLHSGEPKFANLVNLLSIDLSQNGLEYIGDDVFKNQIKIQKLNFSRNSLKVWNISIDHMPHLREIDLSYNQIADLQSRVINQLDKNAHYLKKHVSIFLTKNPLQCTCKQFHFWKWISTSKVKVHLTEYEKCKLENDTTVYLHMFEHSYVIKQYEEMCRSNTTLYACIGLISFVIVLILLVLLYTKRWELRYRWYVYRLRRKGYTPLDGHKFDYDFDAFVSYAEKDSDFVRSQMITKLETEYGCHLCLHERDFRAGEKIASNIISAIHTSNKTIVVLSPAYLKSHWCKYELHMANEEEHHQGRKVVVLLVLDKVRKRDLPAEVLEHYRKNTYIELPQQEENMETFWDALRESIS